MSEILTETLVDTLKMLPFLFGAYLLLEYVEHRAADRLAEAFQTHFGAFAGKSIAVACGRGNNGGDGYAFSVLAARAGARVTLLLDDGSETVIEEKEASYFKLCDDEDLF